MRSVNKCLWPALLTCLLFLPSVATPTKPSAAPPVVVAQATLKAAEPAPPTPPAPAPAPTLTLPAEVKGKPGRYVHVRAKTNLKGIQWFSLDDALTVENEIALKDPNCILVISDTQGSYRLEAVGASGDTVLRAVTVVVIGTPAPPTPPTPPTPPAPADPFTQGLQAAYTADTDPQKATHVAFLAAVYKGIAVSVVKDAALKTLEDLFNQLHAAISAPGIGLAATDLTTVRKYIGADMNTVLGTTANAPLTDALKQTAATEFLKISAGLGALQ